MVDWLLFYDSGEIWTLVTQTIDLLQHSVHIKKDAGQKKLCLQEKLWKAYSLTENKNVVGFTDIEMFMFESLFWIEQCCI